MERARAEGGREIFPTLAGADSDWQFHPGEDHDDGRLLPEVPPGRLQIMVSQRASFQFVQQQAVSFQCAGNAPGFPETGWKREGRALVRGMP